MNYPTGDIIQIGVLVWVNECTNIAIVSDILATNEEGGQSCLTEPGTMVSLDASGNVIQVICS